MLTILVYLFIGILILTLVAGAVGFSGFLQFAAAVIIIVGLAKLISSAT